MKKGLLILLALICIGLFGVLHFYLVPMIPPPGSTPLSAAPSAGAATSEEPILPIPQLIALDQNKVALGERLFHDPRLSGNQRVACVNCHYFDKGATDQLARSIGSDGRPLARNTPTVFNVGLLYRLNWDGKFKALEDQIEASINSPAGSLASNWPEVIARLEKDPGYVSAFAVLYPDGIQPRNIKDAIATFERSLITPNSRFDKFLRGDHDAITDEEKDGYRLFKGYGCVACHQGVNAGGNLYQRFGVFGNYFSDRGNVTKADLGRFNITSVERDRYVFRVPSLRNIALTPPYFHDASANTLKEAVTIMVKYQLGRTLPPKEVELIVKFLNTLTGEYNGKPL